MQHGMSRSWLLSLTRSRLLSLTLGATVLAACAGSEPPAPGPSESQTAATQPSQRAPVPLDPSRFVVLENKDFRAVVTAQTTALVHYVFKDPRYERNGKQIDLVSTDKLAFLPLSLDFAGVDVPDNASWKAERLSATAARFTLQAGELTFVRKLEIGSGPFQLWSTLRIQNDSSVPKTVQVKNRTHHYVRRADEAGGFMAGRSALAASGMCTVDDSPNRFEREAIVEDHPALTGKVAFGSLDTVYFTQALAAHGGTFERCELAGSDRGGSLDKPDGALLAAVLTHPKVKLAPHGEATLKTLAYFGPKTPNELAAAGHSLPRASYVGGLPGVDRIAHGLVGLLAYIHDHVIGNWGLAIILLTFFVKLVLYPLTAKSFQSIGAMRRLKPSIDALNEKYADDREKKGAAMMALYKEHKINPFGGCLPQLLQLPIWWALYTSLSTNVELFKRPFFGFWQDLAAPDPYYALPIALGVLMWIQQKITPSTMDPAQAKMMLYVMPAMITSFMLFLPAGLCLYMFTNSVLSIGQQRFIEYRLAHKHAAVPAAPANVTGTDSPSGAPNDAASSRRTGRGRA
jgi:YidC/Oxa1 family membrane protein insertase